MSEQATQNQTPFSEILYSWEEFGRVGKIKDWVEELKKIRGAHLTVQDWRLHGRAIMISHPIEELRTPLIKKIAQDAGYEYVGITGEQFFEWVNEEKPISSDTPAIIHVEQGVWNKKIDDDAKAAEELVHFQTNDLPKYFADMPCDLVAFFIVTGASYSELVPTLRTVGVFDRRFDVSELALPQIGTWFLMQIGTVLCDESLTNETGRVGKLVNDEFDDRRRQRLIALHMQRLAHRENRKLNFDDLVYFAVHGGSETEHAPENDAVMLHRIAVHEAGHALVSILDSNARNIPDYASILPGSHFKGVVTGSYAYSFALTGRYTYEDSRHKIRVQLAGRVAEAVALGATRVGTFAARTDLINATTWAKELVGLYGFSAEQEHPEKIRDNLAVLESDASASEAAHIEALTRLFLKRQYEAVEAMILENKVFLDAITHALLEKRVLNQSDISAMFREFQRGPDQTALSEKASTFTGINPLLTKVVEHMTGEYTLEEQGIFPTQLRPLASDVRKQLEVCITKHSIERDHGVAIYALNQSPLLYAANLLSFFSNLPLDQLISNEKQTDAEFQSICVALGRLHLASIYFDDTHGLSSDKRLEGLFKLEQTMGTTKLGAIICDHNDLLDSRLTEYCHRSDIDIVYV